MAATVQINEYNGSAAGTKTANITRGHWLSAETASLNDAVKDANPITKPPSGTAYSYEKWHKAECTALGGSISLDNFRHYISDGAPAGGWLVFTSANATPSNPTGTTPVVTNSTIATTAMPTTDPAAKRIAGTLTATGETSYVVTQVDVDNTATAGFSKTVTWAWDEVA